MFKVSSFRLRVFRQCRRRYKYQYVERLPTRPSPYNTMGAHVHNALKAFFSLPEPAERTPERLLDLLHESWQQNRSGFSDLEDEERWRERATNQLRSFARSNDLAARPLLLESYLETPISAQLALLGRVDRVDDDPDGLHIIDYKTGRRPDDIDVEQLHLYTLMLERSLGRSVARASYLYLDDGSAWSTSPQRRDLEEAVAAVTAAYNEIVTERDYQTNVGRHCAFCDYQALCPSREEIVGRRLQTL
ncbi:MAG: PD-(D/E)XK nuclease family protein [Dehalococcoidia bacterium]|jgi:putative RecB family exonuclease